MNIVLSQTDPNDPQVDVESNRDRLARRAQTEREIRSDEKEAKRHAKLDHYFSQHPPNGSGLTIYREVLAAFVNSNGETPRWLTYPQLFASFERLEKRAVLKIEITVDSLNVRHYKSISTAKRRNVRSAELDALVAELKGPALSPLEQPTLFFRPPVHGCRYVPAINKWQVSLYFGGKQRALGCYSFSTALRLQDVLAFHFSSYRRPAHYNTSEPEVVELLAKHPALQAFASALETLWVAMGVLKKPGALDKTEERWQAIEARVLALEQR